MSMSSIEIEGYWEKERAMLNRSWRCLLAVFCFPALIAMLAEPAHAREIVDMSGRSVSVPDTITKVYGASPPVTCMIYAMDPGLIAGLNSPVTRQEGRLMSAEVKNLPVIGGWYR
jgi:iron complex transport system substrate-binding protein